MPKLVRNSSAMSRSGARSRPYARSIILVSGIALSSFVQEREAPDPAWAQRSVAIVPESAEAVNTPPSHPRSLTFARRGPCRSGASVIKWRPNARRIAPMPKVVRTAEHVRLREITNDHSGWRRWGPYLSERSWGTVREDYSSDGNAWDYFPHDWARSKAYRWGEDGLAGFCDRYQILCFALAVWNERDPILKERLFGLVPAEGNH